MKLSRSLLVCALCGSWADHEEFREVLNGYEHNGKKKAPWRERPTYCAGSGKVCRPLLEGGSKPRPRNPVGRTGMTGRGLLGKWGPNLAADPIVTCRSPVTGQLYMVAIKRGDTGDWAIPGGMVDDGELVSRTLMREFTEEAAENSGDMKRVLEEIFHKDRATTIYKGYVDDPRNTDNAWMETVCVHYHCPSYLAERLRLIPGDDAAEVMWLCIEDNNSRFKNLYASHKQFVEEAMRVFKQNDTGNNLKVIASKFVDEVEPSSHPQIVLNSDKNEIISGRGTVAEVSELEQQML